MRTLHAGTFDHLDISHALIRCSVRMRDKQYITFITH